MGDVLCPVRSRQMQALIIAVLVVVISGVVTAQNYPFTILHTFGAEGDGDGPSSAVLFDATGNVYGAALGGGNATCRDGCGLVYELSPQDDGSWSEAVLYSFTGGDDGYYPDGGPTTDLSGNLFGVTQFGGATDWGTVFELSPARGGWQKTTLYSFCPMFPDCSDGKIPTNGLVLDPLGNLYGTAGNVAYQLSPGPAGWTETVLYTFCSQPHCTDGDIPGALVRDGAGNLYGSTERGGAHGRGVIFRLRPKPAGGWAYLVLYNFQGGSDGESPNAVSLHDKALYGTTANGGGSSLCTDGCGTVFELSPTHDGQPVETVLYRFGNAAQGIVPQGPVAFGEAQTIYGVTSYGGTGCGGGCGVVFELRPVSGNWQYQAVHQFNGQDGVLPQDVSSDSRGRIYGTTLGGGAPYYGGVVFEISPPQPTAK